MNAKRLFRRKQTVALFGLAFMAERYNRKGPSTDSLFFLAGLFVARFYSLSFNLVGICSQSKCEWPTCLLPCYAENWTCRNISFAPTQIRPTQNSQEGVDECYTWMWPSRASPNLVAHFGRVGALLMHLPVVWGSGNQVRNGIHPPCLTKRSRQILSPIFEGTVAQIFPASQWDLGIRLYIHDGATQSTIGPYGTAVEQCGAFR